MVCPVSAIQPLTPEHQSLKSSLSVGKRIIWARKRKGISQERLAELIGTSRRHMVRIETGAVRQPGPAFVARIAEVTGCPAELFADEDDEEAALTVSLDDFLRMRIRQLTLESLAEGIA